MTPRVPRTEAFPLVASTVNLLVLTEKLPVQDRVPGTDRPADRVVVPVTTRLPPTVMFPLVERDERLAAPVTARVPVLATPAEEIWSAESLPLPSLMVRSDAVSAALSVVLRSDV